MTFVNIFSSLFSKKNFKRYRTSPDDQTLSRSYSLELRRLSSIDSNSPTLAEHSTYFPARSSSINALVNSALVTSQVSLPTRKVNDRRRSTIDLRWESSRRSNLKRKEKCVLRPRATNTYVRSFFSIITRKIFIRDRRFFLPHWRLNMRKAKFFLQNSINRFVWRCRVKSNTFLHLHWWRAYLQSIDIFSFVVFDCLGSVSTSTFNTFGLFCSWLWNKHVINTKQWTCWTFNSMSYRTGQSFIVRRWSFINFVLDVNIIIGSNFTNDLSFTIERIASLSRSLSNWRRLRRTITMDHSNENRSSRMSN